MSKFRSSEKAICLTLGESAAEVCGSMGSSVSMQRQGDEIESSFQGSGQFKGLA